VRIGFLNDHQSIPSSGSLQPKRRAFAEFIPRCRAAAGLGQNGVEAGSQQLSKNKTTEN